MLDKPISPLRQRMIDDMTARRFNEHTQRDYVRNGEAADERRVHQRRHRRVALLFRRDARTARPRSSSDDREQAAPSAGRAEPGGGGASARAAPGLKQELGSAKIRPCGSPSTG